MKNALIDVRLGPVLLDSQTIQKRIRELGAQITGDYRDKSPHLIGILKGATIFHADLVRAIDLPVSFDFIAVSSYGASVQSSGEVRILKDLDESLEGKDVLLVEDILDTGLTVHYLLQNLRSRNPKSLRVAALLNKPSRRQIEVKADYIGFEIGDPFVVGYGLDYDQRFRNLPDIRILELPDSLQNQGRYPIADSHRPNEFSGGSLNRGTSLVSHMAVFGTITGRIIA
jgi:hypoxanthine phosphoribosyltransferase